MRPKVTFKTCSTNPGASLSGDLWTLRWGARVGALVFFLTIPA